MIGKNGILICLILALTGCSQVAINQAQKKMNETYEPLIGCTEEEAVIKIGAPLSIKKIDDLTIYQYHQIHGFSQKFGGDLGIDQDQAEIVFKNGRAISWKGSVQR